VLNAGLAICSLVLYATWYLTRICLNRTHLTTWSSILPHLPCLGNDSNRTPWDPSNIIVSERVIAGRFHLEASWNNEFWVICVFLFMIRGVNILMKKICSQWSRWPSGKCFVSLSKETVVDRPNIRKIWWCNSTLLRLMIRDSETTTIKGWFLPRISINLPVGFAVRVLVKLCPNFCLRWTHLLT
jgi:hypothetical protein